MTPTLYLWITFAVVVIGALAVDLGIFQRKAHVVRSREALIWSAVWITLALGFNAAIYAFKGVEAAEAFLAGYLIEKSLSVDNLFVFLVIFSTFAIPKEHEARILVWGIVGAVVLRALFVVGGAALMNRFHWMLYVFGALLVVTGIKMLLKHEESGPAKSLALRIFRKLFPVSDRLDGQKFFTRVDGRLAATPLFIALITVETTDVLFAVDSIPAILAVTTDPFIVFTSNVFAILGLRSLYFLLAEANGLFRFLKYGLVLILWFVGLKMLLADVIKIPIGISLATIGTILAVAMTTSWIVRRRATWSDRSASPTSAGPWRSRT